jgi:phospholipid/cholesterol/gamma-HCH transport system substrate-binding protein
LRATAPLARAVALAAVLAAAALLVGVLLRAAGRLPGEGALPDRVPVGEGNLVPVPSIEAGKVEDIAVTPDGQTELTLSIDEQYAPLRHGTHATVRQASLSSFRQLL